MKGEKCVIYVNKDISYISNFGKMVICPLVIKGKANQIVSSKKIQLMIKEKSKHHLMRQIGNKLVFIETK